MKKVYTVETVDFNTESPNYPLLVFERVEDAEEFSRMAREEIIIREIFFVEDNQLAKEAREYINAKATHD